MLEELAEAGCHDGTRTERTDGTMDEKRTGRWRQTRWRLTNG